MRYYKLERTVDDVMVDLERVVCAQVMKNRADERDIAVMFDNGTSIYVEFYTSESAKFALNELMKRLEDYRGNCKKSSNVKPELKVKDIRTGIDYYIYDAFEREQIIDLIHMFDRKQNEDNIGKCE